MNAQKIQRDTNDTVVIAAKEFMADQGVQIIEEIDLTEWRERVAPVYSVFTDANGTELLDIVRNGK